MLFLLLLVISQGIYFKKYNNIRQSMNLGISFLSQAIFLSVNMLKSPTSSVSVYGPVIIAMFLLLSTIYNSVFMVVEIKAKIKAIG